MRRGTGSASDRSLFAAMTALLMIGGLGLGLGAAGIHLARRPLRLPDPQQLVRIAAPVFNAAAARVSAPPGMSRVFSGIAAYWPPMVSEYAGQGALLVTPGFFAVLGVAPLRGRAPAAGPQSECAVSQAYWQSSMRHGSRLGQASVELPTIGDVCRVTGIMPAGFGFPSSTNVWEIAASGEQPQGVPLTIIGRLRPGVGLASAASESAHLLGAEQSKVHLDALQRYLMGDRSLLVWQLIAAESLCMLLAVVGLGNLAYSRGLHRRQEMAVRFAVGGRPLRLVGLSWRETAPACLAGCVAGMGLAMLGAHLLAVNAGAASTSRELHWGTSAVGWAVLGWAVSSLLAAGCAAVGAGIGGLGRGGPWPLRATPRQRRVPLILESLLAVALVADAATLGHSVLVRLSLPSGFRPDGVAVVRLLVPPPAALNRELRAAQQAQRAGKPTGVNPRALYARVAAYTAGTAATVGAVRRRLTALPEAAGVSAIEPAPYDVVTAPATAWGTDPNGNGNTGETIHGYVRHVMPGAFRVLGVPLLRGRDFRLGDGSDVAIVNERAAENLWPHDSALGHTLWFGQAYRIIAVVGDIRENARDPLTIEPTLYLPQRHFIGSDLVVRLRRGASFATFARAAQSVVRSVISGPSAPPVLSLDAREHHAWHQQRYAALVLIALAVLSLLVAGLGSLACTEESVRSRRAEIATRMALGQSRGGVLRMVLAEAARMAAWAMPTGLLVAWLGVRAAGHWHYGVSAADPLSLIGAAVLVCLAVLAGALRPALRSSRLDLAEAVRQP